MDITARLEEDTIRQLLAELLPARILLDEQGDKGRAVPEPHRDSLRSSSNASTMLPFDLGGLDRISGSAEPPPPTAEKQKPEVDPLSEATPEKVKAFVESIQSGQFHNQLDQGAESTLSAILGRQASYEGKEMTWDHLVKSNQHWKTDVELEKLT